MPDVHRPARAAVAALLVLHFGWLLLRFEPAYASPDASGYFVQARLLERHGTTSYRPESPLEYVGVPWLEGTDGTLRSRYPPGLPMVLAAVDRVFGAGAALYVNPVLATLCLLLLFLFVRRHAGEPLAATAALLLATVPVANRQALHADAHTATTAVLLAGLWLLDRVAARPGAGRALAAGIVLGAIPAVRYPEAVAALGVLLFLAVQVRRGLAVRHAAATLAGGALAAGPLLLHNAAAYGAPWRTGYALTHEQSAFSLAAVAEHARPYLASLTAESLGPFLPLGVIALLLLPLLPGTRPLGLLIAGVVLPLGVLYLAYYWGAPGDATNRFFLPALPLLLAAGVTLLHQVDARVRGPRIRTALRVAFALVVAPQVALGIVGSEERLLRERIGTARGAAVAAWLAGHVADGSVVIANRAVQGTLEYPGRWRLVDDRLLPGGARRAGVRTRQADLRFEAEAADGRGPSPHQHGKLERLRARYEGLDDAARARRVLADLEEFADGGTVIWLALPREIEQFEALLGVRGRFARIDELALPTPTSPLLNARARSAILRRLPYWVPEPPLIAYQLLPSSP